MTMQGLAGLPKQILVAQANTLRLLETAGPVQLPAISQTLSSIALSLPAIPIPAGGGGGGGFPALPSFGPINASLRPMAGLLRPPAPPPNGGRGPQLAVFSRTGLG